MYHEYATMKTLAKQQARGFILITVLFLIAVIAVMAVVMSSTTAVQNYTTLYSLEQARGFAAAKSGLEYGIDRAVTAGVCTNSAITLPGINFNVNISCASVPGINEAGNISTVYTLSSTASTGTFGNVGYVTRTLRAMVNQ